MRCLRNFSNHSHLRRSKKLRMSASAIWLIRFCCSVFPIASPLQDVSQHTPLPVSGQCPLFLIPCMMLMFLRSRTTSCETLRSTGITPLHRYGHGLMAFIRVPSLRRCPLAAFVYVGLPYFAPPYLAYTSSQRTLLFSIPATRPVAPPSVRYSSMQSETPGVYLDTCLDTSKYFACAKNEGIGILTHLSKLSGLCV
jgi:hypothetical protein